MWRSSPAGGHAAPRSLAQPQPTLTRAKAPTRAAGTRRGLATQTPPDPADSVTSCRRRLLARTSGRQTHAGAARAPAWQTQARILPLRLQGRRCRVALRPLSPLRPRMATRACSGTRWRVRRPVWQQVARHPHAPASRITGQLTFGCRLRTAATHPWVCGDWPIAPRSAQHLSPLFHGRAHSARMQRNGTSCDNARRTPHGHTQAARDQRSAGSETVRYRSRTRASGDLSRR